MAGLVSVGDSAGSATAEPGGSIALARPKSSTFTWPSCRTVMLAGFRSRWIDAGLVGDLDRLGDLAGDGQRFVHRDRAVREALRQILAFDEFEHEGPRRANLLEAVNLRNVRVIERGERLRFTLEAGEALRVVDERLRQDFSATSRPSRVSRARYTSPMPPAPRSARIS